MKETINWKKHYYKYSFRGRRETYYIIRRADAGTGLFSLFNTNLGHIYYAVKHGYIPVIDMMNYKNCYLEDSKLGTENAWEYYFEQPMGIGLKEAYAGKKVLLSEGTPIEPRPDDDMYFFRDKEGRLTEWKKITHKYIRIKKEILDDINIEYHNLIREEDKVLGVLVRGTDYIAKKPFQHPIQPEVDVVIKEAKEIMKKYGCNKIFVGTEDIAVALRFREEFGDCLVTNQQEYINYTEEKGVPEYRIDRENDYFLRGKEYLTTIVMLSRANCFIGGRTSGTVGVMLLSEGFEYSYVYNLGRYGMEGIIE